MHYRKAKKKRRKRPKKTEIKKSLPLMPNDQNCWLHCSQPSSLNSFHFFFLLPYREYNSPHLLGLYWTGLASLNCEPVFFLNWSLAKNRFDKKTNQIC